MDLLAHALYGATACSRAGIAGGRKGTRGRRLIADWTVWAAVLFGLLPDIVSMGVPFLASWRGEHVGYFFRDFGGGGIILYRWVHSLVVSLAFCGLLRLIHKPLFIPALAWPLHVVMDSLTHNVGKFRTTLFYPLSDWAYPGLPWWQHPWVMVAYWAVLPVTWVALWAWRRCMSET